MKQNAPKNKQKHTKNIPGIETTNRKTKTTTKTTTAKHRNRKTA